MLCTVTPLDEPTLRISLPSSASSRPRIISPARDTAAADGSDSGLSPSSMGRSAKLGFRNAARKASAITAASAPENGAASLPCDIVDAPSLSGDRGLSGAAAPPAILPAPVTGDWGSRAFAIMGVDDPIDPLCDNRLFRLRRSRRMITKVRMPPASRARKPSTTITAMAQWGKGVLFADCTLPAPSVELDVGAVPLPLLEPLALLAFAEADEAEADEAAAAADDSDASDAEDADAADAAEAEAAESDDATDAEEMEAATKSATVVSDAMRSVVRTCERNTCRQDRETTHGLQ